MPYGLTYDPTIPRSLHSDPSVVCFLDIVIFIKGSNVWIPRKGVYVSRDVVFDESILPFASLHPNAGAWLRSELTLLPDVLNPSTSFGDASLLDQTVTNFVPTNASPSSPVVGDVTGTNVADSGEEARENHHYFMCPPSGNTTGARSGADRPTASASLFFGFFPPQSSVRARF